MEFDINMMFLDILPSFFRCQWCEHTAAGLRTRSGSETFLQPDVRRDLFYSFISQIFMFGFLVSLKSHFVKRCCDRGAEASCLRTETEPELRQLRRGGRIHCLSFSSPVDFSFMILLRCRISADNVAAVGLRMCQMKWVWSFQDVTFYQSDVLAAECDDQIILPTNIHFLHFSDFLYKDVKIIFLFIFIFFSCIKSQQCWNDIRAVYNVTVVSGICCRFQTHSDKKETL